MSSASAAALARSRPFGQLRLGRLLPPFATTLGVLAFVELLSRTNVLPRDSFPPVTEVFRTLAEQAQTELFWQSVRDTLHGWAVGLGVAGAIAVPVGVVIGLNWYAYRALRGIVEFMRPIPSVALIPLAVLVYGTGMDSKVFLAVYASTWPLLIQTLYGVRDVDPVAADTARMFGLGRLARFARVTLPSALPYIATGLRISSTTALVLAVTAELVIGSPGLGAEIARAEAGGAVTLMYALIVAAGLLGWMLNILFTSLERRVLHWHVSQRAVEGAGA